jgi:hypothetical protein
VVRPGDADELGHLPQDRHAEPRRHAPRVSA